MYIMVFPSDIPANLKKDTVDGSPMTTDEYLYSISRRKKKINTEITDCLKEAAIDYFLYSEKKVVRTQENPLTLSYHSDIHDDFTDEERSVNLGKTKLQYLSVNKVKVAEFDVSTAEPDGLVPLYTTVGPRELCGYIKDLSVLYNAKKEKSNKNYFVKLHEDRLKAF
jgi:hypothetical protein